MFKKIRRIVYAITILLSIMIIIGIMFVLDGVGIINLGGSNAYGSDFGTVSADVKEVMAMSDEEVWKGLTGGLLTDIPAEHWPSNASEIQAAVEKQIVDITVPIRAWENAGDSSNMNIVKGEATIEVNSLLAKLWEAFFNDLYNDAPDFVIAEVGGYRPDESLGVRSGHSYGAAVDINPFELGNDFAIMEPYSKSQWDAMPETHLKHQIIYKDSNVVKIAHKYTLYWGGDWSGAKKDLMHISFVCDGKTRAERIQMFGN